MNKIENRKTTETMSVIKSYFLEKIKMENSSKIRKDKR